MLTEIPYYTVFRVSQIPTREMNKMLSTEMDVLRRSARKSRMERIKNENVSEREAGHHREEKAPVVWSR